MYCYDPDSLHPDWKELRGASGETEVGQGNTADFSLVFGPSTPGDSDHKPKHVCAMVLTRPDPGIVAASPPNAPILPTLSYVLQVVEGGAEGYRTNGRLALKALWGETVFTEAIEYFNKFAGGPTEEFLDTRSIGRILEGVWDSLFMYLRQGEHAREKRRGKRTEEDGDDACVDDDQPVIEVPKLSPEIIERIILIATESETAPAMISRRAFCGKSPTEGISIWRVFQNVLELVGRSLFIRQLFNARQLYLLGAQETVEIHTDKLAELGQPLVYFFRVPRSIVNEPALVIELFEVVHSRSSTILKPVRPTPYITASQVERAKGNPFVAFANLESVHSEKLKALHPRGLLQPPNIRLKPRTEDGHNTSSFPIPPNVSTLARSDPRWWSSADLC